MKKFFPLVSALVLMLGTVASASDGNGNSFTVIQSTPNKIVLKVEVTGFKLLPVETLSGTEFKAVLDNGTPILEKGAPDLQKLTASVIIPDQKSMKISSATVTSFNTLTNISIAPSKGTLVRTIDPATVPFEYGDVYSFNGFYPTSSSWLREPYIIRDFRGVTVVVNPIQYNASTKELRVATEMIIEMVVDENVAPVNPLVRNNSLQSVNEIFTQIYEHQFVNYSAVKNQTRYTGLTETGSMLIICADAYMADMKDFVDWKMQSGIDVTMVAKSVAGSNAANIKTYIQTYYNAHSEFSYLLLVGDNSGVPVSTNSGADSDQNYGYLAGSDHYPDIFVGRFSAENASHVQTQVDRSVQYEKIPTPGTWYKNGIGVASNQGPGDDNEYDWQHERNIRTQLMGFTYSTVAELYDGDHQTGGVDASGNPSTSLLATQLNNGASVFNYTGHGDHDLVVTTDFYNSDVDALTNTRKLPFIWIVGCQTGNFKSYTCFAEAFARSTDANGQPTGGVVSLMSTINQYWDEPMQAQDEFNNVLTENATGNIKRQFGGISVCGMMSMNDEYGTAGADMTDTWTCFGDPSIMVRTDVPGAMTVTHAGTVNRTASSFVVNCNVNNAQVCLYSGSQIQGTGKITAGTVTIDFINGNLNAVADDSMLVTVTAFNKTPYQGWVRIVDWGVSAPTLEDGEISILPNPAVDEITLNFGNDSFTKGTARVFNAAGQLMKEVSFEGSLQQTIDIRHFAAGLYSVEVMLDEKSYHNKVVVK